MKIGITGHQKLDDPTNWIWVEQAISTELQKMPPDVTALTSLAIGADQLLARLVLERGGKVHAILPYHDIERSFTEKDLPAFEILREKSTIEVIGVLGSDEDAYLAAGQRVVECSDVLIAVWNGKPAVGKGGTADVVRYARQHGKKIIHINPENRTVTNSLKE